MHSHMSKPFCIHTAQPLNSFKYLHRHVTRKCLSVPIWVQCWDGYYSFAQPNRVAGVSRVHITHIYENIIQLSFVEGRLSNWRRTAETLVQSFTSRHSTVKRIYFFLTFPPQGHNVNLKTSLKCLYYLLAILFWITHPHNKTCNNSL